MKIVALMLMALAGIAQAVEIGGNLGVSVTTWKPFDNGIAGLIERFTFGSVMGS